MRINTVGVYWAARRESAEASAERLRGYLVSLRSEFPALADWYQKGGGVTPTISFSQDGNDELVDLLIAGRNRRDIGGQVIDELGFRVDLWNRRKESEAVSFGATCGLFSNSAGLSNAVTLTLPKDLDALSLEGDDALIRLLLLQVRAWSPDWGAVFASQSDVLKNRKDRSPFFDKMLWMKDGENLPELVRKEQPARLVAGGTLYVK